MTCRPDASCVVDTLLLSTSLALVSSAKNGSKSEGRRCLNVKAAAKLRCDCCSRSQAQKTIERRDLRASPRMIFNYVEYLPVDFENGNSPRWNEVEAADLFVLTFNAAST